MFIANTLSSTLTREKLTARIMAFTFLFVICLIYIYRKAKKNSIPVRQISPSQDMSISERKVLKKRLSKKVLDLEILEIEAEELENEKMGWLGLIGSELKKWKKRISLEREIQAIEKILERH